MVILRKITKNESTNSIRKIINTSFSYEIPEDTSSNTKVLPIVTTNNNLKDFPELANSYHINTYDDVTKEEFLKYLEKVLLENPEYIDDYKAIEMALRTDHYIACYETDATMAEYIKLIREKDFEEHNNLIED